MNTSNNEVEFVELKKCFCGILTDLICVSCEEWFCREHQRVCVLCEQPVCEDCYKTDLCCLVRPWGEKEERHLRDFYQNKLVDGEGMYYLDYKVKYGNEYRMEAVKRSIEYYVDNFDASSLTRCKGEFVRDYFPNITKYVENKETRLKYITFMEGVFRIESYGFSQIFLNNDVREDLLTVMDESIRSNKEMQIGLILYALKSKELFDSLKNRKLLDWNLVSNEYAIIQHVDATKWIEQNGVDILKNEKRFTQFVNYSPTEIMEYLMVERGMTVEYMSKNMRRLSCDILRMVYRLKGIEGIQKLDPRKIWFDFEEVKFLKSIGYNFNEDIRSESWIYALICLKAIKYEDLSENQKDNFNRYVSNRDIKACKHLYPFMKEIRKQKIMTVILCIRNLYPFFQKEIIWNILDLAYSPINERGSI